MACCSTLRNMEGQDAMSLIVANVIGTIFIALAYKICPYVLLTIILVLFIPLISQAKSYRELRIKLLRPKVKAKRCYPIQTQNDFQEQLYFLGVICDNHAIQAIQNRILRRRIKRLTVCQAPILCNRYHSIRTLLAQPRFLVLTLVHDSQISHSVGLSVTLRILYNDTLYNSLLAILQSKE